MSRPESKKNPADKAVSKLCQRCLLLTFDTSRIIDAPPPQESPLGNRLFDIEGYGMIPLNFILEDELPGLPELEKSSTSGCRLCLFLKNVLLNQIEANLSGAAGSLQLVFSEFHPDLGTVRFASTRELWLPSHITGEIRIGEASRPITIWAEHETNGHYLEFPDPDQTSIESLDRIKTYIKICAQNHNGHHSECQYTGQISAPLRLLNIKDTETVRIEETDGENLQYAILSYCWGPAKSVFDSRTVMANLDGRMAGFPASSLPKTLQDSIILANHLGATHIWIDALCIVQDSGEWIYESQKMLRYYEMASFTLVPIDSSGAEQGFLQKRPGWVSNIIAWPNSFNHLRFYFPSYKKLRENGPATSSPWASRGWTFQERLLSSKLIFIGQDEVVFRCRAGYGRHTSKQPITIESLGSYFLPLSNSHVEQSNEWNNVDMILIKWYQLVGEYSTRSLTKQSDKLIALSGVATKIGQLLGSNEKYLDGFWASDLWHGLTWRRVTARNGSIWPTVKSEVFPTWSWCCMNQPLAWQDGTGSVSDARLVEIVEQGAGLNREIKMLVLESWVFPIQNLATNLPEDVSVEFTLDSTSELPAELFKRADVRVVLMTAYLDGHEESSWKKNLTTTPHDVYGLVVEPTGETYRGYRVYHRQGAVDVSPGFEFPPDLSEEQTGAGYEECPSIYKEMYLQKETIVLA
ncbi:HET-domain-containing protein [Fusarium austroafricanum]|uniref:HET-domain-containing protein n=1 Tax=Fusarium austroafricanum TaxID=2364996 RepID=A0A8H4NH96_9HYPO|nr:HET-domain-containing protein [Fusarium austroafricanum]